MKTCPYCSEAVRRGEYVEPMSNDVHADGGAWKLGVRGLVRWDGDRRPMPRVVAHAECAEDDER
jgi:hypothetical protein